MVRKSQKVDPETMRKRRMIRQLIMSIFVLILVLMYIYLNREAVETMKKAEEAERRQQAIEAQKERRTTIDIKKPKSSEKMLKDEGKKIDENLNKIDEVDLNNPAVEEE